MKDNALLALRLLLPIRTRHLGMQKVNIRTAMDAPQRVLASVRASSVSCSQKAPCRSISIRSRQIMTLPNHGLERCVRDLIFNSFSTIGQVRRTRSTTRTGKGLPEQLPTIHRTHTPRRTGIIDALPRIILSYRARNETWRRADVGEAEARCSCGVTMGTVVVI